MNRAAVLRIVEKSGVPVQVGGGARTVADVTALLDSRGRTGRDLDVGGRGSRCSSTSWPKRYPGTAGARASTIDLGPSPARAHRKMIPPFRWSQSEGGSNRPKCRWRRSSTDSEEAPLGAVVATSIERDGMLSGPDTTGVAMILAAQPSPGTSLPAVFARSRTSPCWPGCRCAAGWRDPPDGGRQSSAGRSPTARSSSRRPSQHANGKGDPVSRRRGRQGRKGRPFRRSYATRAIRQSSRAVMTRRERTKSSSSTSPHLPRSAPRWSTWSPGRRSRCSSRLPSGVGCGASPTRCAFFGPVRTRSPSTLLQSNARALSASSPKSSELNVSSWHRRSDARALPDASR